MSYARNRGQALICQCIRRGSLISVIFIWAAAWDFRRCGMCDQQRLSSACAYAQFDLRLCLSFESSNTLRLLTEHHLEFLGLKGGCTGSSESTLFKMPHCWKSHVAAHCFQDNPCSCAPFLVRLCSISQWIKNASYETRHLRVRPAKNQISQDIRPSSLSDQWDAKDHSSLHSKSEDSSAQADLSLLVIRSRIVDFVKSTR